MHLFILATSVEQSGGGTSNFQLWGVPIITGIFFLVAGLAWPLLLKRPKLRVEGGSYGNRHMPGVRLHSITVENVPGTLGLKIGRTEIFGHHVHDEHWLFR